MYIFKNAFRNIFRNRGKNILIGVIILVITICTCVGLSIHKAGDNIVTTYKNTNPLAVSFNLDMRNLRNTSDEKKNSFTSLTVDDIKNYADSSLVKDYYYTYETSLDSSSIAAIEDNIRPDSNNDDNQNNYFSDKKIDKMESMGDFRITAYSNFTYLEDFFNGTKKIVDGSMVTGSGNENEIVISKDLADENDLNINDNVSFSLSSDESITFNFTIVGIYEDNSLNKSSSFMQFNVLNGSNQIYANIETLEDILEKQGDDNTKLVASNGLTAKFYLNHNDDLDLFEQEVREKGLSDYYSVTTNESEILEVLKPIQNISSFSFNFLIVIIIIGVVVLCVINFLNIRDRKYEIGVLRAIGMSKLKVTSQLVLEIFCVAILSLVLGTGIGYCVSQPITNKMLENEINSYTTKTEEMDENFGRGDMQKPSQDILGDSSSRDNKNNMKATHLDYVSSLKVKIDAITILEVFGIGIFITVLSGSIASIFVNKYNPNKILQNRV